MQDLAEANSDWRSWQQHFVKNYYGDLADFLIDYDRIISLAQQTAE